jgi:hypothetical protein
MDLQKRIICSLVVDFLSMSGFEYSCSVFIPECKAAGDILGRAEVSEALGLPMFNPDVPVLASILKDYERLVKAPHMMSSYTQTEDMAPLNTLEERLRHVDSEFIQRTKTDPQTIEERMLKYQRESEVRIREEIASEVRRIRDMEISAMRIEESTKYREALQKARDESERVWKERLEALKLREKELHERMVIKDRDIEQKEFNYRQQVIKDREAIQEKQTASEKQNELELQAVQLQKQTWEQKHKELDSKLADVEHLKVSLVTKAEEDFRIYKSEYEKKYEEEQRRQMNERLSI